MEAHQVLLDARIDQGGNHYTLNFNREDTLIIELKFRTQRSGRNSEDRHWD